MSTGNSSSLVLLMTATIDPGATPFVARRDPLLRLRDYQEALKLWMRSGAIDSIIFCENSGYDLSTLKQIADLARNCRVEFLSFDGNSSGSARGKGFAELALIEYALGTSKLIHDCKWILKCTGRLTVANARELALRMSRSPFDVMCQLHSNLSYSDTRVFAATPDFLRRYLLPLQSSIDDGNGVFLEHALARAVAGAIADRKVWRPLPVYPRLRGISGTDGRMLSEGVVKGFVKSIYYRVRARMFDR